MDLLVDVVCELVVAAESYKCAQTETVGEENLSHSVDPHLQTKHVYCISLHTFNMCQIKRKVVVASFLCDPRINIYRVAIAMLILCKPVQYGVHTNWHSGDRVISGIPQYTNMASINKLYQNRNVVPCWFSYCKGVYSE